MKLWEVIKELTENKDKKFVFDNGDRIYTMSIDRSCGSKYFHLSAINDKGADISELDSGEFDGNFTVNDDWQEVKQPVTWQEAIQEFAKGKKVTAKFNNQEWTLGALIELPEYLNRAITNGKWYIE